MPTHQTGFYSKIKVILYKMPIEAETSFRFLNYIHIFLHMYTSNACDFQIELLI
jgi:hypothetical protein